MASRKIRPLGTPLQCITLSRLKKLPCNKLSIDVTAAPVHKCLSSARAHSRLRLGDGERAREWIRSDSVAHNRHKHRTSPVRSLTQSAPSTNCTTIGPFVSELVRAGAVLDV
ncbi:hypothetical protein EVAR_35696_1 [Eumeta japonica]|uniref:Uncharacterized protein n=1 Tax=Eumeta variegata TaxID=151549 RepID=A0A4C1VF63_EUMVA|nr:hypothetical protein EVAR_35696_1 [Eumeta japonica]